MIAYLSGMRPGEVLTLERGCIERSAGMVLVCETQWNGARDDTGAKLPEGQARPDSWVAAEPVATAVAVLERLHNQQLLFPNTLANIGNDLPGVSHRRVGRARDVSLLTIDIAPIAAPLEGDRPWRVAQCYDTVSRCVRGDVPARRTRITSWPDAEQPDQGRPRERRVQAGVVCGRAAEQVA